MKNIFAIIFIIGTVLSVKAGVVDTVEVYSASMKKKIKNVIIKPDSYKKSKTGYPVLYLLHGAGGNYAQWIKEVPKLKQLVDKHQLIIVCPDGGFTSWYFDSPVDENYKYETYVANELVVHINKSYKILKDRSKHAITGLSMGGHGSFYLAFKHQDVWGAAGSMSGGLDLTPFPNGWNLPDRLGKYSENKEVWEENSVINMLHLLGSNAPKLIFDCGTSDFFFDQNNALHKKMLYMNIPHDYIERPGSHNWNYWRNAIEYQLLYFSTVFKSDN